MTKINHMLPHHLLIDHLQMIKLPNPIISNNGGLISSLFCNHQILTLWDAITWVYQLPYGRTSNRAAYWQVPTEKKGTCSTKHALIAALAEELSAPLQLVLCIFLLKETNTPEIEPILKNQHLTAIPEAHCYLKYQDHILDITFPDRIAFSSPPDTVQETAINPEQIGHFKIQQHQNFIRNWIESQANLTFEKVWAAREQYIQLLGLKTEKLLLLE